MISFRSVMAAPLILLILSVGIGYAADSESAMFRKRVDAAHAGYARIYKRKDMKAVEAYMKQIVTPDFRIKMPDARTLTLRQWMAEERKNLATVKRVDSFTFHIQSATASGNVGKTRASAAVAMSMVDPKGKSHKMTNSGRFTEVYVLKGGDWKLKRLTMFPEQMLLDGKPWNPVMMAAPPKPSGGYRAMSPRMKPHSPGKH